MNFFYILGWPLGYVMEWIYNLIPNYGWDIILFTLLVRLLSIPLTISQQKNTAKMSAFQPMITEIQKKYKNDQEKQQEEMTRLQQDFGYNPMSGCAPMLVNFFVMFGVIEVVYRPLQRIFHISTDALAAAGEALTALGISFTTVTRDTHIVTQVLAGESSVVGAFTAEQAARIADFGRNMSFFGINLMDLPVISLAPETLPLLLFPALSIVTMLLSTHFSMRASGQELQGSMKIMMYASPLLFVFFCFTVPVAFSLYYTVSNILMMIQSEVMRRIYDPKKIKAQIEAEIADKRKEQKRGVKSTTVKVVDEKTGSVSEKNLSASEMNKRRLEYARMLDEEKYKDERTEPLSQTKKED